MLSLFISIILLIAKLDGGWPITQPNTTSGRPDNRGPTWIWEGGEKIPVPYNMVDAWPSCSWLHDVCPMFSPGGELSAFPNSEEKVQHILHNMFRMFGNQSLDIKWGKWQFAVNKNAGKTYYCKRGCDYCGATHPDKVPLYWYSDANQAARFKQYDENSCDQAWYKKPGNNAHTTCGWVLDEYGGGSHCDLFGSCSFEARGLAFSSEDDAWFETEGICGANTCYRDPHCDPIFANKYDYQGTGFVEGMNGASGVYAEYTDEINYTLHSGAHLDQRMRLVYEDRNNENGAYFTLMAGYMDVEKKDNLDKCWSLYDGTYHEMGVEVSFDIINGSMLMGGVKRGTKFGSNSYNVLLASYHEPPINTCEPYAFLCRSQSGKFFRLPQDESYFFGTEWLDWKWSDHAGNWNLSCRENHYYYNEYENGGNGLWVVNSGYRVMNPGPDDVLYRQDIWYYQQGNECIGCSKIAALQCVERCIQYDLCDDCPYASQVEPPLKAMEMRAKTEQNQWITIGIVTGSTGTVIPMVILIVIGVYYRRKKKITFERDQMRMEMQIEEPANVGP